MDEQTDGWATLVVLYPDRMNQKELAAFVTAVAGLHGVRTRVEGDALVWVRRERPSPAKAK